LNCQYIVEMCVEAMEKTLGEEESCNIAIWIHQACDRLALRSSTRGVNRDVLLKQSRLDDRFDSSSCLAINAIKERRAILKIFVSAFRNTT
jgi:hypothetical protein